MKKEKTIRTYQRRTKTGKIVTVKQHTAKYDAAEALKEAAKKKGAGDELEGVKKRGELDLAKIDAFKGDPNELSDKERQAWQILTGNYPAEAESKLRKMKSLEKVWAYADAKSKKKYSTKAPKETKVSKDATDPYSAHGFTKDEFKEWYEGTGSKADKKVEKALKKAMGTKAYNALSDKAADEYKKGGAHSFFTKGLEDMKSTTSKKETAAPKEAKTSKGISSKKDAIEWFKGNSNYIVTKDGKVYEKLSNGKKGTEVKSKYLVSHAQREDNLARVTDKVAALASEYGFKKSEADTVARWTGGKGEPNGKLYRKMSDIPQKVVSDYAKFEDVSPRQARLEMLGMPVGEYNSYLKDAGITTAKKEVKTPKSTTDSRVTSYLTEKGFKERSDGTWRHKDGREAWKGKDGSWVATGKMPGVRVTLNDNFLASEKSVTTSKEKKSPQEREAVFKEKHAAKVEEWKKNGNIAGLKKEIAGIRMQYGSNRKKADALVKPLEEAIEKAKANKGKPSKSPKPFKHTSGGTSVEYDAAYAKMNKLISKHGGVPKKDHKDYAKYKEAEKYVNDFKAGKVGGTAKEKSPKVAKGPFENLTFNKSALAKELKKFNGKIVGVQKKDGVVGVNVKFDHDLSATDFAKKNKNWRSITNVGTNYEFVLMNKKGVEALRKKGFKL